MARAIGPLTVLVAAMLFATAAHAQRGPEYVLVQRSAFLHAAPDASSERARDPWANEHAVRLGPYWVLRLVAERGDWLEVSTLPRFRAGEHCYPTVEALRGLELTLFVARADVALVTTRTVARTLDDGTGWRLAAGVGLVPRGPRRFVATVRGATLAVELGGADTGVRYVPGEHIAVSRGTTALLAPGGRVELGGGGRLEAEPGPRGTPARPRGGAVVDFSVAETRGAAADGPPRTLLGVETAAPPRGRTRATVRGDCVEVSGFVVARDLTTDRPARAAADLGGRGGTSLRPGAMLTWPDGSRAGRATEAAALDGAPRRDGPRVCFDHPLRAGTGGGRDGADRALTLCVDRSSAALPSRAR